MILLECITDQQPTRGRSRGQTYKTSHASIAKLQSSKHAGAKHNLTQNQDSKSFKVTCFESVEKQ